MAVRDYLIVEEFLRDAMHARVLQAAFDLGVIDRLAEHTPLPAQSLWDEQRVDTAGGRFLLQMLVASGVLKLVGDVVHLTEKFRDALLFRDLLQTRLKFSQLLAGDYFGGMDHLLRSADDFMSHSVLFELFDYGRCSEITRENCMKTSRWMELTTMLTRYEAPVCAEFFDFSQHTRMLDVGGNSGEFALQVCRGVRELTATVFDLPVVCEVGRRHVAADADGQRVSFHAGNMLEDPFPGDCDLISWKSVLHDWPDHYVSSLLQKTFDTLPSRGRILIFERQSWDFSEYSTPYGLLPVFLFFRSYRDPQFYVDLMKEVGFQDIEIQTVELEVPFVLATGAKAGSGKRL